MSNNLFSEIDQAREVAARLARRNAAVKTAEQCQFTKYTLQICENTAIRSAKKKFFGDRQEFCAREWWH